MKSPTREDLELYVIGEYDGDVAALEQHLTTDETARAIVAEEAALELALRAAGAAGTFCPACDDVVRGDQCESCGASVRAGGYAIERVIVSHAHGRMYVARDADRTLVALKELAFVHKPDAAAHAAFECEARMLRALEHPAIPRFVASFEEGSGVHTRYYLAQELVEGESLAARLSEHFFDEREIVEIARQVLRVLVYLQGLSPMVVHRDIKPANLVQRGDGSIAVVDFGAAHVQGATIGATSIGTFGYMPVEQMVGIVDATTDTYALGASLLHLLTRREPWKLLQQPAWDAVNVSAGLRAYLQKLVAAEPRDRFVSAEAALHALEHPDHRETTPTTPRRSVWWVRRAMIGIAACAAVAGVGRIGYVVGFRNAPEPSAPQLDAAIGTSKAAPGGWRLSINTTPPGAEVTLDGLYSLPERTPITYNGSDRAPPTFVVVHLNGFAPYSQTLEWPVNKEIQINQNLVPAPVRSRPRLTAGPSVDLDVKAMAGHDVLRLLAKKCKVGIVIPDVIDFRLSFHATQIPCGAAFEDILEAHGLWYVYEPDIQLVRIAPRKQLDQQAAAEVARATVRTALHPPGEPADDVLPAGANAELDFKNAPLRDLLMSLTSKNGFDVLLPEDINGHVTVTAAAPWNRLVPAILAAYGLGYRSRGKLIRVGVQKQLDAADEAEVERRGK